MRLAYLLTPEESHQIHDQVIRLSETLSANLNPVNYFLFFEYVIADNLEFVKEINRILDRKEKWTDILGTRLRETYFKQQENEALHCEQEFSEVISELTESIHQQLDEHNHIAENLAQNPKEAKAIAAQLKKASRQLAKNMNNKNEQLQATRARLIQFKQTTMLDLVTRLNNKIHFEEYIEHILKEHQQLIILLIDIDHFEKYNDINGQHRADSLLRSYAKILQKESEQGYVWRIGADEFILLLTYDDLATINDKVNHIHKQLSLLEFKATSTQKATKQQPVTMVIDQLDEHYDLILKRMTKLINQNRNKGKIIISDHLEAALNQS